jgi:hypothetical protein
MCDGNKFVILATWEARIWTISVRSQQSYWDTILTNKVSVVVHDLYSVEAGAQKEKWLFIKLHNELVNLKFRARFRARSSGSE